MLHHVFDSEGIFRTSESPCIHNETTTSAIYQEVSTCRFTVPLAFLSILTASSCVHPSRLCPLTDRIWSPRLRLPSSAAAPLEKTFLTYIGRSPWGLPWPPTMEKPRPSGPRSRVKFLHCGGDLGRKQQFSTASLLSNNDFINTVWHLGVFVKYISTL